MGKETMIYYTEVGNFSKLSLCVQDGYYRIYRLGDIIFGSYEYYRALDKYLDILRQGGQESSNDS